MRFELPPSQDRGMLVAAAVAWMGAWIGRVSGATGVMIGTALGVFLVLALRRPSAFVMAAVAVGGVASGMLSVQREVATLAAVVPDGPIELEGVVLDDPRPGIEGVWFLLQPTAIDEKGETIPWSGPTVLVSAALAEVAAGDRVLVGGTMRSGAGRARGDPFAGRMAARSIESVSRAGGLYRAADLVRTRVQSGLADQPNRAAAALVSGFLIGDIRELPEPDREALRRAGLSHYVAVSGSNVALFLLLWWLLLGPLAFGSRRRALFGLAGLALFIVVTRWEPSVLRAAMMAGLILLGRGAGLAIGPWSALGGAVCLLVLVSGELVEDVGFQLSVAATAGVMLGATVFRGRRHRRALTAVVAAASAQLAVAPLLLIHFGFVPVLSPLTNLVAGPVVVAATTLGGIGLLSGFRPLVDLATAAAALVLAIARTAAPWPQAGLLGLLSLLGVVIGSSVRRTRPVVVVGVSIWLLLALGLGSGHHGRPAAVFLDVGQGDSILLLGALGETILIDGGPDPGLLIARLRDYGVDHVDLLVASHHHHDHSAGLPAVVERVPVGRIWYSGHPNPGPELEEILRLAVGAGIPAVVPSPGWSARVGEFSIEVLGPLRRYASPNDQSLVLLVRARGETIALPGDIEAIAQRELGPIPADILKVPHQGAATSDLEWLAASAPQTAVISVGPNDYGHPAPEVIKTLSRIGAAVRRTDQEGDVVLLLGE